MRTIVLKEDATLSPKLKKNFPHSEARRYQADLAETIYRELSSGSTNIAVEGPTGLGKWSLVDVGTVGSP